MGRHLPKYPVYVISKGRHDVCLTAQFLLRDGVPFRLIVEPQEAELYAQHFDEDLLLVTDFSNVGSSIPARNFAWEHARAAGHERHWLIDDNIREIYRTWRGKRIPCEAGPALAACEDFTDRYQNIAISGLNYQWFVIGGDPPPFTLNCRVYSCLLIKNDLDFRWRGKFNEDTDLCLNALAKGWCTVLFNAFLTMKMRTMTMKGGNNNAEQYKDTDGRLKMSKHLEREWPYVVETKRRFQRPQHVVRDSWKKFDTQLILKPGIDLANIEPDEYGMKLRRVKDRGSVHGVDA